MDDFYRVVAIGGAVIVMAGALWIVVRLQREHRFSWFGTLVAGGGAILSLVLYNIIVDIDLKGEAVSGLVASGALAGALFGTKIPLYQGEEGVYSRAAGWHLALPAVAIAAFQVMGVRESVDGVILSYAALYAATGFAVAASTLPLIRRLGVRPAVAPAKGAPAPVADVGVPTCSRCGSPVQPHWRYCMGCGASV